MEGKRLRWMAGGVIILALLGMLIVGLTFFREAPQAYNHSVEPSSVMPSEGSQIRLRREKGTLSIDQAKMMISAHNFYCLGWNDSGTGIEHKYEIQTLIVVDHATGLTWQKSGSDQRHGLQAVERYLGDLNAKMWAGFSDWRLPTLEEAMSLMTTDKDGIPYESMVDDERVKGVIHLNPAFGKSEARFIWTSDSSSPERQWIVYFWDGECLPVDINAFAYIRAVRSPGANK